ncbi:hypothetical protein DFP72DRAFT_989466 [Ephemerocybe angulata]|uniref:Rhodanese domain-containing protein n=1 Tax=Ephemerocybe angulata TaxID=980116 RepID=A0A8H6I1F0_9AGAR|nr:hypothetical protein DFP72DRAFT_989466 [Tulosesus angulatus]
MARVEDYKRYGRQMILDGFGLQGQINLSRASVAVVGAGGLGCPALQYLGAAGVGRIGIFDHDRVEISNLQRQILHNEETVGMYKAESAKLALLRVNSRLVIDADNVPTRYLLSDTAVALKTPLVSGAAQKFDGQLCVYHYGENGPCYRCIFPVPPKPSNALEAIKILTGLHDGKPVMHIYNALSTPAVSGLSSLRSKREGCPACGTGALEKALVRDTDYSLSALLASDPFAVEIIDVRQPTEFGIMFPLKQLVEHPQKYVSEKPIVVTCRLGNDSQTAADALRSVHGSEGVTDLIGGLRAWSTQVDRTFPQY